jgi:hypothetical protein
MQNMLKEYAFVVVSIVGALVFFFVLQVMLRRDSETSIVNMLKSSMQYVSPVTDAETNYGRDTLDENLDSLELPDFYFDNIANDDGKQYKLTDTDYQTSTQVEVKEDADGNSTSVSPAIYTLTADFLLDKVKVRGSGVSVSDITITVIDYTPKLIYPESDEGVTSITGRLAPDEDVIEVDKYGNKIVDNSSPDGYKHTTRTQYEQRNQVDSSTLAADDYDDYYGDTYFYLNGTWYWDSDLDGTLSFIEDDLGNKIITDAQTGPLDLGLNDGSYDGTNGIKFKTDLTHKFKVIYRVNGNVVIGNADNAAMKAEMTKMFVATPRRQVNRSLEVYEENYEEGVLKGKEVDTTPTEKNLLKSEVADYSGLTGDEVLNSLAESKLAAVQAWQEEEKEERAEAEAEAEKKATEETENDKAKSEVTVANEETVTNEDTENVSSTESNNDTDNSEDTENVEE